MIGGNMTIYTKRLVKSGAKEAYGNEAILNGISVAIYRESLQKAALVDQANALDIFRMDCDRILDVKKGDLVFDQYGTQYTIHTVFFERGNQDTGDSTMCYLRKKND